MTDTAIESGELTPTESLLADSEFKQQYLAGDTIAMKRMTAAFEKESARPETDLQARLAPAKPVDPPTPQAPSQEPQERAEAPSPGVEYPTLRFTPIDRDGTDFETLMAMQNTAAEIAREVELPPESLQVGYELLAKNAEQFADDPEHRAEERRGEMDRRLKAIWGDQYDANLSAAIRFMQAHPRLDAMLYETGAHLDADMILMVHGLATRQAG